MGGTSSTPRYCACEWAFASYPDLPPLGPFGSLRCLRSDRTIIGILFLHARTKTLRRKITDKSGDFELPEGAELPELTPQQAKFVEQILSGSGVKAAYKAAYNCSAMSDPAIRVEASRLRHHPNVALTIHQARLAAAGAGKVTLEAHIDELERLKEIALSTGNVGAAVQAEQLRGKAMGHYTEQVAVKNDNDPRATLRKIAEKDKDLADRLAQTYGIDWH